MWGKKNHLQQQAPPAAPLPAPSPTAAPSTAVPKDPSTASRLPAEDPAQAASRRILSNSVSQVPNLEQRVPRADAMRGGPAASAGAHVHHPHHTAAGFAGAQAVALLPEINWVRLSQARSSLSDSSNGYDDVLGNSLIAAALPAPVYMATTVEEFDDDGDRLSPKNKHSCLPCLQAKTKCDGKRPCNRCIRRKTTQVCLDRSNRGSKTAPTSVSIYQCSYCYAARVVCTGDRPCERCVKLGFGDKCEDVNTRKRKSSRQTESDGQNSSRKRRRISISDGEISPIPSPLNAHAQSLVRMNPILDLDLCITRDSRFCRDVYNVIHSFSPLDVRDLICGPLTSFESFIGLSHLNLPLNEFIKFTFHVMSSVSSVCVDKVEAEVFHKRLLALDGLIHGLSDLLKLREKEASNNSSDALVEFVESDPQDLLIAQMYFENFQFENVHLRETGIIPAIIVMQTRVAGTSIRMSAHLNIQAQALWGYSQAELNELVMRNERKNFSTAEKIVPSFAMKLFYLDDWPELFSMQTELFLKRRQALRSLRVVPKSGNPIECVMGGCLIFNDHGTLSGFVGGLIPISYLKRFNLICRGHAVFKSTGSSDSF